MVATLFLILSLGAQVADPATVELSPLSAAHFESCGLNCLYCVLRLMNVAQEFDDLRRQAPETLDGVYSFSDLAALARPYGLDGVGRVMKLADGEDLQFPCIAQLRQPLFWRSGGKYAHYVVLVNADDRGVDFLDPPRPLGRMSWSDFKQLATGNVLEFQKVQLESPVSTAFVLVMVASVCVFVGVIGTVLFVRKRLMMPR